MRNSPGHQEHTGDQDVDQGRDHEPEHPVRLELPVSIFASYSQMQREIGKLRVRDLVGFL